MSAARLNDIVQRAIAAGVLPADASAVPPEERPWPVIVLTALGGWLAALPILAVLAMLLWDSFGRGPGPLIAGFVVMAVSVAVLRHQSLPLFVEQLAFPLLLAGGAMTGFYIGDKSKSAMLASAFLAPLAIVVAVLVARNWLRILLGATACGLALGALMLDASTNAWAMLILALYLATAVWAASQFGKRAMPLTADGIDTAHALDAVSMGWGAVTLAGLALYAGSTFLAGAIIPGDSGGFGPDGTQGTQDTFAAYQIWHVISALAAIGAAAHLYAAWQSVRQTWAIAVAVVAVGLSALMPTLGATLLFLALCATAGRWRMAASAGLAAAWIIGAFYYQMSLPFATKAIIMMVAGIGLGASAWLTLRGGIALPIMPAAPDSERNERSTTRAALGIAATAIAVFAAANFAIWQKQDIIANGKPVFVELAPVDPRSLMQGDYMTLRFVGLPDTQFASPRKLFAVGSLDSRGVLTISRLDDGAPLAADELRIELIANGDSATIVTNAWYFREGEADRFAGAKYGEFRVMSSGRALLVGMRGPNLEKL